MLLNSHSSISIPHEAPIFEIVLSSMSSKQSTQGELSELLSSNKYVRDLRFSREELDTIIQRDSIFTVGGVVGSIFMKYVSRIKPRATVWGDKTIGNIDFLPDIFEAFPKARFVYLLRDPRDILVSLRKVEWHFHKTPNSSLYCVDHPVGAARLWNHCWTSFSNFRQGASSANCTYLMYEDLLKSPKKVVRSLCDFLELEYEESVFDFYKDVSSIPEHRRAKNHENVSRPILASNFNNYVDALSKTDVAMVSRSLVDNPYVSLSGIEGERFFDQIKYQFYYLRTRVLFFLHNRLVRRFKRL
jgi:hypothetical protein